MVFLNIRNAEALESPCAQQIRSKSVKVPIPMCIQTFLFAFALNILSASFDGSFELGNYLLTRNASASLLDNIELVKVSPFDGSTAGELWEGEDAGLRKGVV